MKNIKKLFKTKKLKYIVDKSTGEAGKVTDMNSGLIETDNFSLLINKIDFQ